MLDNKLQDEFGSEWGLFIQTGDSARVDINVKDKYIILEERKEEGLYLGIVDYLAMTKQTIYIDDPFILDGLSPY